MTTYIPLESSFPLKHLKFAAPLRREKVDAVPTGERFIGLEQVESWTGRLSDVEPQNEPEGGANVFRKGDVLFGKLRPYLAKGWVAEFSGFSTTESLVLTPQLADARFVRYCLLTNEFISAVNGSTFGSKMPRADWAFIGSIQLPFPSPPIQERIADFLDGKTARIDALIAEKECLRKTVQEYEQAEASDLLARGVQRHRLFPTGKEFVTEAPKNWKVVALKRALVGLNQGWSPQCESRPADDGEWGVLKVGCVNGTSFNATENKALPASLEPDLSCLLHKGDVLVSRANTRELVGKAALVDDEYPNLLLCDKLYRLTLRSDWVLPEFVVAVLRSGSSRQQIELGASGASSSMQNISQEVIRELVVALPPVSEQKEIVARLGDMRKANAALLQHVDEHLARLREYRSALISAAVTGQLDLAGYEATSVPDTASQFVESDSATPTFKRISNDQHR